MNRNTSSWIHRSVAFLCLLSAFGCEPRPDDSEGAPTPGDPRGETRPGQSLIHARALVAPNAAEGARFERLSAEKTGIDFVSVLDDDHPRSFLYHTATSCGGVGIGDVDGDERPDIYLVSGPGRNRLYRQVEDLEFEDVTERAGVVGGEDWGVGVAMVDIEGDGDLDIYVCNFDARNALYINDGRGRFKESARESGVDFDGASIMAAFCDYDLDGDLDFYILTNRQIPHYFGIGFKASAKRHHFPVTVRNGQPEIRPEFRKYYSVEPTGRPGDYRFLVRERPDCLYRNNGDGTFTDVTSEAGEFEAGLGLSATWWDFDDDGYPDLYVGNDFDDPDHLYHNNGDGTFTDVLAAAVPHTSWFSMGAGFADINGDGLFDFLTADMSATTHFKQKTSMGAMNNDRLAAVAGPPPQYMRNALYLNTGTDRFMEVAYLAGLADTDWTWAVKLADLDVDGRVDVFVTNGVPRDTIHSDLDLQELEKRLGKNLWEAFSMAPRRPERNLAFRNEGDLRFRDVGDAWGLGHVGMSYAAAQGDLDRDGDLDLVVVHLDEPVGIYRNATTGGHRVLVRLVGTVSNRYGVGAKVRARTSSGAQVRQLMPTSGFLTSDEPLVHFGLGASDRIDELVVQWPSGHRQTFSDLAADRLYTITEPGTAPAARNPTPIAPRAGEATLFGRSSALAGARHRERPYDDFGRQPLLPNRLSQLGPGMAWGDADGDGDDDVFVAGAAGQEGALYLNQGGERFLPAPRGPWAEDRGCEDMAPLWLDVDGDGDEDLFVASGGVERDSGDPLLRNRVYLNDETGGFTRAAEGTLPTTATSSSVAAAADFDADGDLDLFVGGRVVPGAYPLAPPSQLLRNDGGVFADVTDDLAAGLSAVGMVTGALWSDADGDDRPDLLLTVEWGAVRLFRNAGSSLEDETASAGLSDLLGWWNSIAGGDVDGDGDIDYAVMNFGLNTKYHASPEKPALLYYGDLDGTSKNRLVEAEFEDEVLYPMRGKSCSTAAMPFLEKRFTTYKEFALASLQDIYSPGRLQEARRFKATTLESGILVNDGTGRFEFRPLPRLAQAAPGFGCVLANLDGDEWLDLYLVQNFFSPQPETGRMDGGVSLLLTGSPSGTLTPVWPRRSGLVVQGDAKALTTCDLNADGWPDLVVTQNDDEVIAFSSRAPKDRRSLAIRLRGRRGNPNAIGSRVTVVGSSGVEQTLEVYAGSGYLSQSAPLLFFGRSAGTEVRNVRVRWPEGRTTTHVPQKDLRLFVIEHPGL